MSNRKDFDLNEEELIQEILKNFRLQFNTLNELQPYRYVISVDAIGFPNCWLNRFKSEDGFKWLITIDANGKSFMYKDEGVFGFERSRDDDKKAREYNSFTTPKEAYECFKKWYPEKV